MSWIKFDIKSFLKESKHWEDRIQELKAEQDALLSLPSVDNSSGVRSSEPSDMTASMALRRLKIQAEIEELELNREMLNYALKRLTEDERALVKGFYFPKKKIGVFVQEYGRERGMCKNLVYQEREATLEKMREIIEQEYYGEKT